KKADAALAAGTPRAQLYATLTQNGLTAAPPTPPRPGEPDPNVRFRAAVKGAPARGPSDALVTIVEWSDFQCPFCKRVEPTLARVMEGDAGKVRLVLCRRPPPRPQTALGSAA